MKVRVQLDMSERGAARLDALVERLDAASRAETVRRAVDLLTVILDAQDRGADVVVVHPNGPTAQIHITVATPRTTT